MAVISVSLPADGETADVSDYNTPITTITNEFNGNIDNANIKSGAAIDGSKLADDSIAAGKIVGIDKSNLTTDSNPYKFSVYRNSAWTSGNGVFAKVAFNTELFDTNNNFDAVTNNRYVAPVDGFYMFTAAASASVTATSPYIVAIYKNNAEVNRGTYTAAGTPTQGNVAVVSALLQLAATDYVEVFFFGTGGAGIASSVSTYFQGFLVSRT
jgi:hypothetical protein